jgi:hypothetical protein
LATVQANQCLAHEANNAGACPGGNAPNFAFNYAVRAAGTLTSLWAERNGVLAAGTANTVSVRRNGIAVMSCVASAGETGCAASGSVALAVGDFLQVQILETTGNPTNVGWKVYVGIES